MVRSSLIRSGFGIQLSMLTLKLKGSFPLQSVEWLFTRVRAKMRRNSRMDLEAVIMDDGGDLMAVNSYVALVVGAERNMSKDIDSSKELPRDILDFVS